MPKIITGGDNLGIPLLPRHELKGMAQAALDETIQTASAVSQTLRMPFEVRTGDVKIIPPDKKHPEYLIRLALIQDQGWKYCVTDFEAEQATVAQAFGLAESPHLPFLIRIAECGDGSQAHEIKDLIKDFGLPRSIQNLSPVQTCEAPGSL